MSPNPMISNSVSPLVTCVELQAQKQTKNGEHQFSIPALFEPADPIHRVLRSHSDSVANKNAFCFTGQ